MCTRNVHTALMRGHSCLFIVVPKPLGGALVIGQESITYYTEKRHIPIAPPEFMVRKFSSYGNVVQLDVVTLTANDPIPSRSAKGTRETNLHGSLFYLLLIIR